MIWILNIHCTVDDLRQLRLLKCTLKDFATTSGSKSTKVLKCVVYSPFGSLFTKRGKNFSSSMETNSKQYTAAKTLEDVFKSQARKQLSNREDLSDYDKEVEYCTVPKIRFMYSQK
jgi:hypothetical protein